MNAVNIRLSGLNFTGIMAGIQDDENGYETELYRCDKHDPVKACQAAADRLRVLADRFDALAKEKEPLKASVQRRINRNNKK